MPSRICANHLKCWQLLHAFLNFVRKLFAQKRKGQQGIMQAKGVIPGRKASVDTPDQEVGACESS